MIISVPKRNWLELWQGPLHFRNYMSESKFSPGTSIDELIRESNEGDSPSCCRFDFDKESGALILKWHLVANDGYEYKSIVKYYQYSIEHDAEEEIKNPQLASRFLDDRSHNYTDEAGEVLLEAEAILSWIKLQFDYAIQAGSCLIYARVGSILADFTLIPPDVFRRYNITNWGQGVVGGGEAELSDEPTLYSIYVAPANRDIVTETGVPGRPSSWKLVEPYLKERLKSGQYESSLTKEARHLSGWLGDKYPDAPSIQFRTMENKIRDLYNAQKSKSKNTS